MADLSKTVVSAGETLLIKNRYAVESELGRGGMSVVYLAQDRQLMNKRVVIKVLLDESQEDAWIRRKFLQEMEALARIDHPGVVGALDTGETDEGRQFLVMQFIEGNNLRQELESNGPLEFTRAATIFRQVGQALSAAHEKGVWHRDLTPDNIMLQKHGGGEEHTRIIDFGIAGIQDSAFGSENTQVAGKYSYMSPEQFAGRPSGATDVWAMGVCAYEILTGRKPFSGASLEHLISAEKAKPAPLETIRPGLPVEAGAAVLRALSFNEQDRFSTPRDFGETLARTLTGDPVMPVRPKAGNADGKQSLEIAHILFMDLIGYSLLPMDKQREYLDELQRIVRDCGSFKQAEASQNIISLPTGDGMALAFFGDPTLPAQCAFEISKALRSRPHLKLRMGIHTGPVYRVADINANANVAGGGINMAQRVMDSGDDGHVLVSKAVADVLTQLSNWKPYLIDLGERPVKHGVMMHIFNLATTEVGNPALPKKFVVPAAKPKPGNMALIAILSAVLVAGAGFAIWKLLPARVSKVDLQVEPKELTYSFTVQRRRDGKTSEFQTAGNVIFEKDYGVAINLSAPKPGYLYVLNEGPDDVLKKRTFAVLSPLPGEGWDARLGANKIVRIPQQPEAWFRMDLATGSEQCYVVWSTQPIAELEQLKTLPVIRGKLIVIEDEAGIQQLKNLLTRLSSSIEEKNNVQNNQTELRTNADILVHKIPLRHQ